MPVENFPLHNVVLHAKSIVTMQRNHLHVIKVVPTSYVPRRSTMVEPYVDVHIHLTIKIPSHTIVTTEPIPPNPRGELPEPPEGTLSICVTLVPYFKPYKRPFNYPKYKKYFNPNVHVRIFKATIRINREW